MASEIYVDGTYQKNNPTWHVEDSLWKAQQIARMFDRNKVNPKTICEIGCGAGEVLHQLQQQMGQETLFWGWDISPQAIEMTQKRVNEKLHFELKDIMHEQDTFFDMILVIDLIEHLEDYFSFLRAIRPKSEYKLFHIPLEMSAEAVYRSKPMLKVRKSVGHLHYFSKDIALQTLKDTGYELIDYFYTASGVELEAQTLKRRLAKIPRKFFFQIHQDWTARVLGGFSLLVMAR